MSILTKKELRSLNQIFDLLVSFVNYRSDSLPSPLGDLLIALENKITNLSNSVTTGEWENLDGDGLSRILPQLTLLDDGTVLCHGGCNAPPLPISAVQNPGNRSAVIVDPVAGTVTATGSRVGLAAYFEAIAKPMLGDVYVFGGATQQEFNMVPSAIIQRYDVAAGTWHGVWKEQESVVPPTLAPAALNPATPGTPTLPYSDSGGIFNLPAGTTTIPLDPAVFGDDTGVITPAISQDTNYILGILATGPFLGDSFNIYRGLHGDRLTQVAIDTASPNAGEWSYQSGDKTIKVNVSAPTKVMLTMTCRRLNAAPSATEPDRMKRTRMLGNAFYIPSIAKIVIIGGAGNSADPGTVATSGIDGTCATVEIFDPTTGLCVDGAAMPIAATFNDPPNAVFHEATGKVYVFGGIVGGLSAFGTLVPVVQIYDPALDTWSTGTPMPITVSRPPPPLVLPNGKIVICGGALSNAPPQAYQPSSATQIYDPVTDTWDVGGPMPVLTTSMRGFVGDNGRIYILGGQVDVSFRWVHRSVQEFCPTTKVWRVLDDVPVDAGVGWGSNNVLLPGGKVLHAGGAQGQQRNYLNLSPPARGHLFIPPRS